jgi:iron complex transport system permease protein
VRRFGKTAEAAPAAPAPDGADLAVSGTLAPGPAAPGAPAASSAAVTAVSGAGAASPRPQHRGKAPVFIGLTVLLVVIAVASLALGRYHIGLKDVVMILLRGIGGRAQADATSASVLLTLRLPRIIVAALVGAALAGAGSAYQGLFRNPMVSPDILGASEGAGFGAAIGILFALGSVGVEISAFIFGVLAVLVTYVLSAVLGKKLSSILVMVLAGMVVGNLFMAFTSAVKFVADPNSQLPEITFWLMGGLSAVRANDLVWLGAAFVVGTAGLMSLRWRLNVMACGEEEAMSLGVDVRRVRWATIAFATLMTSSAVAIAGMVGWVGLIIPHLARFVVGSDHRRLVPASMLMGAAFLLLVDDICRSIYTTEIALAIVTSVVGAPLFVFLVWRQGRAA